MITTSRTTTPTSWPTSSSTSGWRCIPVVVGAVLVAAARLPRGPLARGCYQPIVNIGGVIYSIPSLALFAVILPVVLGTGVLSPLNVVVGLSLYTLALLTRTVADALISVQGETTQAAFAMGYRPLRQLFGVELPMALPVLFAGLRVATVANISLVSVGAFVGVGGLGALFTSGFQLGFIEPIIIGIVLSVLLAGRLRHRPGAAAARADPVGPGGGALMTVVAPVPMLNYFGYLFDPANWTWRRLARSPSGWLQHIAYTLVTAGDQRRSSRCRSAC